MEMRETAFKYDINPSSVTTSTDGSDRIGSGGFGEVQRVYTKKHGVSAAKIFKLTGTSDQYRNKLKEIKEEADILAFACHENVVRFQAIAHWSSYVAILMQYEVRGSLHHLLDDANVSELPFKLRYRMAYEISRALVFLHNFGIDDRMVHGDLKSSNILLNEDLHIRVADFGAANIGTITCGGPTCDRPTNTTVHTVAFSAPELLKEIFRRRSPLTDVFSFGRVLYELITRQIPFRGMDRSYLSAAVIEGIEEPDCSMIPSIQQSLTNDEVELRFLNSLIDWMNRCCVRNPANRPTMQTVEQNMKFLKSSITTSDMLNSVIFVLNQMPDPKAESLESSRITLNHFR